MKAVMKTRPKPGVEVKEIPVPTIRGDEVLIKVRAAAICGSDLGIYNYTPAYSKMKLPVVMGHEFSGEIVEAGPAVEGFKPGDRVLAESVKACGGCGFCRSGMSNLCDGSTLFGIHTDGGFAEYIAVPHTLLHGVPDTMSYEEAALVEPLSNALHFVRDITPFRFGDLVVVQGCGPIGLFSAQLFRLGLETLNIEEESLRDRVTEISDGEGADVAYVAVGAPEAVKQATEIVKKRGHVTVVGIFGKDVALDMTWVVRRELTIAGAYDAKPSNFPTSIDLISRGQVDVMKVLTHRFSLDQAEEAFRVALDRSGGKVEFIPG